MREGRVLVVDDNPIVLDVLRVTLEAEGFLVDTEESVFRISDAIRRHRPEVILLDVKMPALSGNQAAEILKKHKYSQDIPVLFFSDLEMPDLERLAAEAGVAGCISKATEKENLLAEIRRWTGRPVPAQAGEPTPALSATVELDETVARGRLQPLLAAGGDLFGRMVDAFERQLGPRLESLRAAAAAGQTSALVEHTHFLTGSSRVLGAVVLVGLLEAMERRAKEGRVPDAPEIDRLVAEAGQVSRVLREILEEQTAPAG